MFRLALIAVNENCEKREASLRDCITRKVAAYPGFGVIDFADLSIDGMIRLAKEEADRTILVFDAEKGMNPPFSYAASKLYEEGIRPILLISNSDHENADIPAADISLAEIWSCMDPALESWDLYFHNLYFSYNTMGIDTSARVETDNIDALMRFFL